MLVAEANTILALLVFGLISFFRGNIPVNGATRSFPHVILETHPLSTTTPCVGGEEKENGWIEYSPIIWPMKMNIFSLKSFFFIQSKSLSFENV